jgi:hypothetical protein
MMSLLPYAAGPATALPVELVNAAEQQGPRLRLVIGAGKDAIAGSGG